jgi:hypothetical protein
MPSAVQRRGASQAPMLQLPPQHSASDEHPPSAGTHSPAGSTQSPPAQLSEQHIASDSHVPPIPTHAAKAASAQTPASQRPVQHPSFALHATPIGWQISSGWVQSPFAQRPEQHSSDAAHAAPVDVHEPRGSAQLPLAQRPEQHCGSWVHSSASVRQVGVPASGSFATNASGPSPGAASTRAPASLPEPMGGLAVQPEKRPRATSATCRIESVRCSMTKLL